MAFLYINKESAFPFRLGLDLTGGTHLIYQADTSKLDPLEVDESMKALRDVIERRVNLFGVSEPIVQLEKSSIVSGERTERLIVELPGVTDVSEAIRLIGATPLLEFKLINYEAPADDALNINNEDLFIDTGLTGRFVERAQLQFGGAGHGGLSNEPIILISFNNEGAKLFGNITREHIGEQLAIFLDGNLLSQPVIQDEIPNGQAILSGNFTPDEARELARDLNFGALPVPIELLSTQAVGASLGQDALEKGVVAGLWGLLAVALFIILWYRLPGLIAVISLSIYMIIMLAIFKLIPITLTSAGVAGFILSIGMAVDANILIFERVKEELKEAKDLRDAVKDGFKRAWRPIKDGNISSILTAVILFWLGTSIVEGFALTFGLGVIVSMITAISITRTFLLSISPDNRNGFIKFIFGSGIKL